MNTPTNPNNSTPPDGEKLPMEINADGTADFHYKRITPTHSAQEAAERGIEEYLIEHFKYVRGAVSTAYDAKVIIHRVLRHFSTQSQQPPLSPGSGEALRAIAAMEREMADHERARYGWTPNDVFAVNAAVFKEWHRALVQTQSQPPSLREAIAEAVSQICGGPQRTEGQAVDRILAAITPFLAQPATPPLTSGEARHLLDWAEAIICNGEPMSHCTEAAWEVYVKNWRDAKHAAFPDGVAQHSAPPLPRQIIRDCLLRAKRYILDIGDDKTMAPEVESIDVALEQLSAPPLPSIGDGKDGERLNWVAASVAATWPEGSAVLHRMRVGDTFKYEVHTWHRPDHMADSWHQKQTYLLLASPQAGREEK